MGLHKSFGERWLYTGKFKMAVGKNKRLSKGKKGTKKKIVDPFSRKDWYDVKAPSNFNIRNIGKTVVTRTIGTKIASDGLKGRVFEMAQADLNQDEVAFRKFKLICEDVQGKNCMTNFHGMTMTTDKLRSLVKKWQTCIEAHCDVKTTDGYLLRVFAIGFTRRRPNMNKKAAYAINTDPCHSQENDRNHHKRGDNQGLEGCGQQTAS